MCMYHFKNDTSIMACFVKLHGMFSIVWAMFRSKSDAICETCQAVSLEKWSIIKYALNMNSDVLNCL